MGAEGPQLPNLHALGLLDNKNSSSTEGFEETVKSAVKIASVLPKAVVPVNITDIMNTGVFRGAGLSDTEGLMGKKIMPGAEGMSAKGGVLAQLFEKLKSEGMKLTDHGVVQNLAEGVGGNPHEMQAMSYGQDAGGFDHGLRSAPAAPSGGGMEVG